MSSKIYGLIGCFGQTYSATAEGLHTHRNPYIGNNFVRVNHVRTDITWRNVATDNGWKFYGNTGILIANDDDHYKL
jgi:hypothetical protein